jgi:hypothetical protein
MMSLLGHIPQYKKEGLKSHQEEREPPLSPLWQQETLSMDT